MGMTYNDYFAVSFFSRFCRFVVKYNFIYSFLLLFVPSFHKSFYYMPIPILSVLFSVCVWVIEIMNEWWWPPQIPILSYNIFYGFFYLSHLFCCIRDFSGKQFKKFYRAWINVSWVSNGQFGGYSQMTFIKNNLNLPFPK